MQWIWLLPLAVIIWYAPESPTWCVKYGRSDRAREALKRLSSADETDEQIDNRLAMIEYTNELERHYAESTSWLECFKGVNLRRTEIAIMVYSSTNLDGYDIGASESYFFQQAGMSATQAFDLGLGNKAIALVTCLLCWVVITRVGRRPLYVFALGATVVIMLVIGGFGIPEPSVKWAWATGGMCYCFDIIFHICQGPLTYSYIAEIPSTRLRSRTVVIARGFFIASAVFMVVLVNYQINATAWNCEYTARVESLRSHRLQGEEKLGSSGQGPVSSCSSGPTFDSRRPRIDRPPSWTSCSWRRYRRESLRRRMSRLWRRRKCAMRLR